MTRDGLVLARRLALFAALAALVLTLSGDRTSAGVVPATVWGQDPLEVLALSVKPNVFVVLDTSGSMAESPYTPDSQWGGDFTGSKMYQAKQVLKAVFQANQTKAQFLFGTYRYSSEANTNRNMYATSSAPNRFLYSTQSWASGTFSNPACTVDPTTCPTPNPGTVTLPVQGPSPSMATTELYVRSLYAFQWIQNSAKIKNNVFLLSEGGGSPCTLTIPPGFYSTQGAALAIQAAMTSCSGKKYAVNYGTRSFSVSLTRAGTTATATSTAAHNLLTGATVTISGAPANRVAYNGTFTVTVTGANTFTYVMTATPGGSSSGTATVGTSNRFSFQGAGTDFTLLFNNTASTFRLPVALSSLTSSGTTVTATTTQAHGLSVGSVVNIMGAADNAYNGGPFTVTSASGTTFTYTAGSTPGTSPDTGANLRVIGAQFSVTGTAPVDGADPRVNLLARTTSNDIVESFDPDGASTTLDPTLDKPSPKRNVTTYFLNAQKFWNGETVYVDSSGNACGITDGTATNPPTVSLQLTSDCTNGTTAVNNADPKNKATFTWGGGQLNGAGGCQGFQSRVPLIPCDQLSPPQYDSIGPFLENQLLLDPATGSIKGYTESNDGLGSRLTPPSAGGVMASSNTPLAQSVNDIRVKFADLWKNGQPSPKLDAIMNHLDPKEKTVVIMVTDGMQNCWPFVQDNYNPINSDPYSPQSMSKTDAAALGTAAAAQKLYDPGANGTGSTATVRADGTIDGDVASSVTTYVVGFGMQATDKPRLNVIAWGGSGLRQAFGTYSNQDTWTRFPTAAERARCLTCTDAFIAPDPDTLKKTLQSVIDVGASSGEFSAQQTITESVFEYVDKVASHDARSPSSRYGAIVPTRVVSSFELPGFRGQLKAYQNDGAGNAALMWSAGDKLRKLVAYGDASVVEPDPVPAGFCPAGGGMCSCPAGRDPDVPTSALCTMSELGTHIKRRIYTTDRNGVYSFSPTTLMASGDVPYAASSRVALWPPSSSVLSGSLDGALGLPSTSPSCFLVDPYTNCQQQVFADLQEKYKACMGTNLPAGCSAAKDSDKLQAALDETRELILAFMAGAQPVEGVDASGLAGWKRSSANNALLYSARSWVLADSELATPAVVTPPSLSEPSVHLDEYKYYRDGAGTDRADDDTMIRHGFGLAKPDDDGTVGSGEVDTRSKLKPVMTVVYAPANDMLHAFRAGPCYSPSGTPGSCLGGAAAESGGEELWGFVPFDQLGDLALRFVNNPQSRANHVYMLARGIRFADVFVPGALTSVNIGGTTVPSMAGVWRRVLFFGRGIGGKYVTALDVTAPGPYTAAASQTVPPIPLWSRGNPDTYTGKTKAAGGTVNVDDHDYNAYLAMGETWSMPTVALVKTNPFYTTARRSGIEFVLFMGSGYGNPKAVTREGTTHYTLDALSGDVVAYKDVEDVASLNGLTRSGRGYANAIVANSVSFNRSAFAGIATNQFNTNPHPWAFVSARVYFGDVYGRLWKILTADPTQVLPAADLGADQPVGTAVALLGENLVDSVQDANTTIPNIFVTTGADRRAVGPFRNYSLLDTGQDTEYAVSPSVPGSGRTAGVSTFPPVKAQFVQVFDQGDPVASCTFATEAFFRGTIQPTSAVECNGDVQAGVCKGTLLQRVFFGGTRLSEPNSKFAPPTPLACNQAGQYPCRSQFDSILYALGVEEGGAAYDLNTGSASDAYRIFRDSRIAAIGFQADPEAGGGSQLVADEGLIKGTPKPPPVPGVPPTTTSATASVVLVRVPGQPAPVVQYGSTVCQ